MEIPTFIQNHEAVVNFYGYWPSFHDANVPSYRPPTPSDPSLEVTMHTWQMTNEVDPKGFFILRKHALVTLRFNGVDNLQMDSFAAGNILFGLTITKADGDERFSVEFDSVMEMSGTFIAMAGMVVSVVPCASDGTPV